jgi:LytS/YehU family sensor histidine kinase
MHDRLCNNDSEFQQCRQVARTLPKIMHKVVIYSLLSLMLSWNSLHFQSSAHYQIMKTDPYSCMLQM